MKFTLRPGVRNIKELSTARMRRVSHRRPIVQEEKQDNQEKKQNQKACHKE
jgi:hypothetical protein